MLAALVAFVPLLTVVVVWRTKHTPLPASTVPDLRHSRASKGLVLIFALVTAVFLSVQLEQLSSRGTLGETVHRLGLVTYFLVTASLALDHALYFYKFRPKTAYVVTWLRNWLLLAGLITSVLHVFNALNYELGWNLENFELLSSRRQVGLTLGLAAFSLGLGVIATNPRLYRIKLLGIKLTSAVYLMLILGLAHAFIVGTDFVSKGPYTVSFIITLAILLDLAVLRMLHKFSGWLVVLMLVIVTIGSLLVLNSRYDKDFHRHSYRLVEHTDVFT